MKKKKTIQTRIIIDYDTSLDLIESMGEDKFIKLLDKVYIITTDDESFYFIKELKNNKINKNLKKYGSQ